MKKIVYVVLLLLVLGGVGFFIYSRNKSSDTPTREYGILNPNPAENAGSTPVANDGSSVPVTTETPSQGKVLGEVVEKPTPAPSGTASVKTKTQSSVSVTSTTSTYKITGLNLEITVPKDWKPRLEEASGNVVAFYGLNGAQVGQIEVLVDAQESFDALSKEIQANPNVSNIQQTVVNGQQALIFNDQRFGGGKVIALVRGNNVYYFRGAFAQQTYYQNVKFIN